MCYSKAEGGGRCIHEMNGTRAVQKMAEKGLDISSKDAKILFKREYRKAKDQGIGVTPASPNEITEFISEQKYQLNGSTFSEHDKKIIGNNLRKAGDEQPSQRGLTAWKSIMKRVWRKQAMAFAATIGASTMLLTACSSDDATPAPNTTQPTITASQSATPAPEEITVEAAPGKKPLDERGFELSEETYMNSTGTYRKWVVSEDSPLRDINNYAGVTVTVDESQRAAAEEAWGDAIDFITQEYADSTYAGDILIQSGEDRSSDEYVNKIQESAGKWVNSDTGEEYLSDSIIDMYNDGTSKVPAYLDPNDNLGAYSYKSGEPRILDYEINLLGVQNVEGTKDIQFNVNVSYTRKRVNAEGNVQYLTVPSTVYLAYNNDDKEPADNTYKMVGYYVEYADATISE